MRRIVGGAVIAIASASMLVGLTGGTAHASTICEGEANGQVVVIDTGYHTWIFECYDDGKARYIGGS
ncbi:MAG TPA: hypothetical protein VFV66_08880 [Nonomuraea sp.]|nr:hypothetical protein [Nonomuraea sp.]